MDTTGKKRSGKGVRSVANKKMQSVRKWFRKSKSEVGDVTDAVPVTSAQISTEIHVVPMVVDKHSEEYNMDHPNRGKAVIFFNYQNDESLISKDVVQLESTFIGLEFESEINPNFTFKEIDIRLKQISRDDHSNNDCFVCVIHTEKDTVLGDYGTYDAVQKCWEYFAASSCPSLAGKPKMFFISASRGKEEDVGVRAIRLKAKITETDASQFYSYKTPNYTDFLIVYSSCEDYVSHNDEMGSRFVQSLCKVLSEQHTNQDVLTMMTTMSRNVAFGNAEAYHDPMQIPVVNSTLIRDLYLKPKRRRVSSNPELD